MGELTALIAEDEPLMLERLREQLGRAWPELSIVAEASNGDEALAAFLAEEPDVAFLDIRMPGKSGLEVAAAIGTRAHVVFITAYDEFAIKAFEAGAVDYLLKPVDAERLTLTVERVRRRQGSAPPDLSSLLDGLRAQLGPTRSRLRWIKAAVGKQLRMIPIGEVIYLQADTKYTRVVLKDGEALIRTSLKELLDELDPERFWQIHRGTIVNVDAIKAVYREEAEKQFLVLKERSERLVISRQFYHLFKQM